MLVEIFPAFTIIAAALFAMFVTLVAMSPVLVAMFAALVIIDAVLLEILELQSIPGYTATDDANVFLSITYEGVFYGKEFLVDYGMINEYGKRFIVRRLGYVRDYFSIKLRGASRSRMAFSRGKITHG